VGLTGALKVNTKEDMAENSKMIVLWGSNIASQPNRARHIVSVRRRGAKVITIDVRSREAAAQSDEVLLIRPGSDAALALAVMHGIVRRHLKAGNVGFHKLQVIKLLGVVLPFTPAWGAKETGLEANQIISFARAYASTRPAMILLGDADDQLCLVEAMGGISGIGERRQHVGAQKQQNLQPPVGESLCDIGHLVGNVASR
jgi:anaerobic selenocysteine-containing dehydrogenase